MECSLKNKNVMRMKVGYLKKSSITNGSKMLNFTNFEIVFQYSKGHPACSVEQSVNIFTV